jgi:hypothetical protein
VRQIERVFEHSNVLTDEFDREKYSDLEYLGFDDGELILTAEGMIDPGATIRCMVVASVMGKYERATHLFDFRAIPIDRDMIKPKESLEDGDGYFFTCCNVYGLKK